jgi:hypothetical protein
MARLVWRVKLIAELEPGVVSETEVARIERDDFAVPETLGRTLDEGKQVMAAAQTEIVRAQVCAMGERFRWCEHCGAKFAPAGQAPSARPIPQFAPAPRLCRAVFKSAPLVLR